MKRTAILLSVIMITGACANDLQYPETRRDGTVDEYFGEKVEDPYRWLEDDASEETAAWVQAQNTVTDAYMKRIKFRGKLLQRLKEVNDYEKVGVPSRKKNGKWYFYKNDGLQNQSVMYEADSPSAEPKLFLDPNKLSEDGTVALKGTYFSGDCKYMAYIISRSGSDWEEIYVMDVQSRQLLEDHIVWAKFTGAVWQGNGFYYAAYDAPDEAHAFSNVNEYHKLYYHKIGTPQSEDRLFYVNKAYPKRFYQLDIDDDEALMFLYEDGAGAGNNLYIKDLRGGGEPGTGGGPEGFIAMTSDMDFQYSVFDTDGSTIYIITNWKAPKYRIMTAEASKPQISNWKELVPEGEFVLEGAQFAGDRLLLSYNQDASTHAYLHAKDGSRICEIALPSVGSAGFVSKKGEPWCYYSFSSYTVPGTIYSLNLEDASSTLFRSPKVGFNLDDFCSEQVFFQSKDGTRIPMFLTYKKGLKKDGGNPVLLYGYGGFNISLGPAFSAIRIPFLEKGGIYAEVNLRGGGEYGEEWHQAGTKMNKQNVFDDFIGAAEWLIAQGWTCPEKLAINGGSNGGLLVGACMAQRPDLYAVAVPQVGVMDMLRYHKFTIGWNWAPDYGTSEDSPEMFHYLRAYSPLHNLKPGVKYPATLVTTADHDDRVVPAHSFKFAATLQACVSAEPEAGSKVREALPGTAPAIIRIDSKAGHGGGKPLAKILEERADIYGFIMYNLGMGW